MKLFPRLIILLCASLFQWSSAAGQNADIRLLRHIHNGRDPSYDGMWGGVSTSAYVVASAIPLAELLEGIRHHDTTTFMNGCQAVVALGINTVATFGLKYAVNRKRPYITYPDIIPFMRDNDPSFPSGHTSFAFAAATSLSLSYPHWYVIVPSAAWATVVGYSRLVLGMHYPSDVAAGAVVGISSAVISYEANRWLHHRKKWHYAH